MSVIDNTDELRLFVEDEVHRLKRDPRRPGLMDVLMLAVIIAASVVVTICWVSLIVAPDHYPVDTGRVMLTSASAASIIAATFAGMFSMNRASRRRHEQVMEEIRRGRCGCPGADEGVNPKDLAMRSFETGRRIGRREADG